MSDLSPTKAPPRGATTSDIDFEDLFEAAPCGYLLADRHGRITRANQTFATWTGFTPEWLVGKRFPDLLPIAGKIFYETHVAPTLHMQSSINEVAFDILAADGRKVPMLVNATEHREAASHPGLVRFTLIIAADRRTYERELLVARDTAQATVLAERADAELRDQFIAVLGHDLRNPLASIASGVRMLEKEPLSERGRRVLGLMDGSVARALGLIDNVLDFARARLGGGIVLDRDADEPLEPALRQVVAELRSTDPDRVVVAHYALEEPVNCDRARIAQLLSNLLGNAMTHGDKNLPVRVDATTANDILTIAVSNGGAPIPPAALERLFQPFYRENDRVRHGLGLGLHIASEIARAHGGTLTVRSGEAETVFTLDVPLPGRDEASP